MTTPETATKKNFVDNLPWYTVPAILIGVPLLFFIVTKIVPGFFDAVIEPYYWGPIRGDEGYNAVNTLSWALLMGVCLLGLVQMMRALKVDVDGWIVFGATGWVFAGSLWHVLEDTELFASLDQGGWLKYIFITPPIYLLFTVGGILSLLVGLYLKRVAIAQSVEIALAKLWVLLAIPVLVYLWAWHEGWSQVLHYITPWYAVVSALITFLVIRMRVRVTKKIEPREFVLMLSMFPFLMFLGYVRVFEANPWHPQGSNALPMALLIAPALAALVVFIARVVGKKMAAQDGNRGAFGKALQSPVNGLLIFGQSLDGIATSLGLDFAGYTEKHVLSAFWIDAFRKFAEFISWDWGAAHPTLVAFVPLKIALSLVVIYFLDIAGKEEDRVHPNVLNLFKFAIIMVGLGPGVRDFVRLSLGV